MRPSMERLKEKKKKNLIGAEIGVWKGNNAFDILTNLDIKKLYLVDPYVPYLETSHTFLDGNGEAEETKKTAINKLQPFEGKTVWHFLTSMEAVKQIEDNSLDFVYIDGNHQYEYVRDDVQEWTKKVKTGGLVCGHDANLKEVHIAVSGYCEENEYEPLTLEYKKDKKFWQSIADSSIGVKLNWKETKQLVGKDELIIPKDWWFWKEKPC